MHAHRHTPGTFEMKPRHVTCCRGGRGWGWEGGGGKVQWIDIYNILACFAHKHKHTHTHIHADTHRIIGTWWGGEVSRPM